MCRQAERAAFVLAGLTFLPLVASAQEQRSAIEGVARDSQGAPVPGVAVVVTNGGGLALETVTDARGRFRFAALAPGRYASAARLAGFKTVRVEGIVLLLGQQLAVEVTLVPASLEETVDVVAESPTIAIAQSARATSLRGEDIEKMPKGRDFTSLVGQVAGANFEKDRFLGYSPAGSVSVDGASGSENRILIDGAETVDLIRGISSMSFVSDFVEEVQVKSSGYTPEFGGSTGSVVSAITRSGTNEWRGKALVHWSDDALDASLKPALRLAPTDSTRAEYTTYPEDDYRRLEPGLMLGGPIAKDRVWFFAGYLRTHDLRERTAPFSDGTTGTTSRREVWDYANANVTAQLGREWRARTSFNLSRLQADGILHPQDGTGSSQAPYDLGSTWPQWTLSTQLDWNPSSRLLTSLRGSYFWNDYWDTDVYEGDRLIWQTSSVGMPGVPSQYQQPRLYSNVPFNYRYDTELHARLSGQLDATCFFDLGGRHQAKAGVQLDRIRLESLNGTTGNILRFFWGQSFQGQRGAFGYYNIDSNDLFPNRGFVQFGEGEATNVGFFVQDAWTIAERLTLHLGLRAENEHLPSFAVDPRIPDTAIHFGFGDKLAPRLGFAWDATGDGRTKLYGSWGVFYDTMKLAMPLGSAGNHLNRRFYTLDSADLAALENNPRCPPECPGRPILGPVSFDGTPINDPDDYRIDRELRPMKLQELVVGVERAVRQGLSLHARYIHKQVDRAVEDVGSLDADFNALYLIANPGFGSMASFYPEGGAVPIAFPSAQRDYDAIEVGFRRQLSGGWAARASYTWSRLWGNYSGLASSDTYQVAPNWGRVFDNPRMAFDERARPVSGRLATDRTHQFKAHLLGDFRFGTSLGASFYASSGIPRTRFAQFVPAQGFPVAYVGRESDGRLASLTQLDLSVQHRVRLGGRGQVTLSANVINVFDQGAATDYYQFELFTGQAINIPDSQFYAGFSTQQLIAQQGLVRDARFLMNQRFQDPRSVRLAVEVGF